MRKVLRPSCLLPSFVAILLAAPAASADPITWSFTEAQGATLGSDSDGNAWTLLSAGVPTTSTDWSFTHDDDDDALEYAALGPSSIDLGACTRFESCTTPPHVEDYVLFLFDGPSGLNTGALRGHLPSPPPRRPHSVPEPSSLLLVAAGIAAAAGRHMRRRRSRI